jgi:hypothetical protein
MPLFEFYGRGPSPQRAVPVPRMQSKGRDVLPSAGRGLCGSGRRFSGTGFDPYAGFGAEFRITLRLRGPIANEPTRERVR